MKKVVSLIAFLALLAALAGGILYLLKLFERRRGLFCYDEDDEDYDDIIIGSGQNYYDEDLSDLSPNASGNTAPIGNAEPPADAAPQEY